MTTTITASLTLTDSGSPYSSSTSTPISASFAYTEKMQQTVEVAAAATATIALDSLIVPKLIFFRLTTGVGTYVISDNAVGTSVGSIDTTGGWVMLVNMAAGGTLLDKIVFTATSTSVLEFLAYG